MHALSEEIARNFDHLQRSLATLLPLHESEFALLRHGAVVGFFDDAGAADRAGMDRFSDRIYSIQQITDEPIELGFYAATLD